MHELQAGIDLAFCVFPKPPGLFEPSKRAFDNPALRQYSEGMKLIAFCDLHGSAKPLLNSVGKVLVNAGEIPAEQISVPAIRDWLAQHPEKTKWLLRQNAIYVFFARDDRATQTDGPPGAMALAEGLTPGYSVAVDPDTIPLGTPILLSSTWPDGNPFQRIVIAQDKGCAIKGVVRADLFLGAGEEAEHTAGLMKQATQITVLRPRGLALFSGLTAYVRVS